MAADATSLNPWILVAGVSGFVAVAAGAFGAHVLAERLSERDLAIFETAARYQLFHTVGLVAVLGLPIRPRARRIIATAFVVGILVFSGSLYALALSGVRWLGAITPLGGTAFLVGWIMLALQGRRRRTEP